MAGGVPSVEPPDFSLQVGELSGIFRVTTTSLAVRQGKFRSGKTSPIDGLSPALGERLTQSIEQFPMVPGHAEELRERRTTRRSLHGFMLPSFRAFTPWAGACGPPPNGSRRSAPAAGED
jgi:hypothetical protein